MISRTDGSEIDSRSRSVLYSRGTEHWTDDIAARNSNHLVLNGLGASLTNLVQDTGRGTSGAVSSQAVAMYDQE